jgi:hypothetical protein
LIRLISFGGIDSGNAYLDHNGSPSPLKPPIPPFSFVKRFLAKYAKAAKKERFFFAFLAYFAR